MSICPSCKRPFNTKTKTYMLTEILGIVKARNKHMIYSALSREQAEDIYNWVKKKC